VARESATLSTGDGKLTEEVSAFATSLGADLVGIAPVERFSGAPLRMSPQGLLPDARCVIVVGIHHPDACVELGGEPTPQDVGPYAVQYWMNSALDDISFLIARFLEGKGYAGLPIAASNIWRYRGYKDLAVNFAPDLAHRYAAVAAGLGEIGYSGLCLVPQFGPRVRFVSVVTNASLVASPMYHGEPLCDRCMECVKRCPNDVFRKETRGMATVEIGGRKFSFPDTNKWRCAWTENFDLSMSLPVPEKVDEEVVLRHLERYGRHKGEEGSCLKFCMVPALRYYEPDYCRAPRRKKMVSQDAPETLRDAVLRIVRRECLDAAAAGDIRLFPEAGPVHPQLFLPDARTVISLGARMPEHAETRACFRRRLMYAAMDVCRLLDRAGHSSVCMTRISDPLVARRLGILADSAAYATVLTSARLPAFTERPQGQAVKSDTDALRSLCKDAGADLVGFFNLRRFSAFREAWTASGARLPEGCRVEDAGDVFGAWVPVREKRTVRLQGPDDVLPGSKSVIVIGVKLPDASVDTAKVTPAETVGPYVFASYEVLLHLEDIAYAVIRRLNACGYRAALTCDLTGLASTVASPRGPLPNMRANALPAALAGLAVIGRHGCPMTPQFGVRQRFIAIATDMEMESDPLLRADPCATCDGRCVAVCPTGALAHPQPELRVEKVAYRAPVVDQYACDWAARLGLSGREGPSYCGLDSDRTLPECRTCEAAMDAVASVRWGVQKHHLQICEECVRVCPAHLIAGKEESG